MTTYDSSKNLFPQSVSKYADLIKTVAKVEYKRLSMSSYIIELSELVNIGATAVYVVLSSQPEVNHTTSYMSTAIKWAIRNEFRKRYKWYSCKFLSKEYTDDDEKDEDFNKTTIRDAVYETIFSVEEMADSEKSVQIEDTSFTPDKEAEFLEMSRAVRKAMKTLPEKERMVLETRFYKNKKIKEIALEMNVTPSRISKILQVGLDRIKVKLEKDGLL
jgi:RNA polymerase sigma factor (sigma-70 family)